MGNLIIAKNTKQALSQNQLAFNKLTVRIEKLRSDINKKTLLYDKAMEMYSISICPLRIELALHNRLILEVLWPIYKAKKFSTGEQKHFKGLLGHLLDQIFENSENEPDDFMKTVFRELEGITYDAAQKQEEDEMKDEMQDMFDQMDMDINMKDFDMNDKGLAEKMAEAQQKLKEKHEQEHQRRQQRAKKTKKTVKQLEKEKMQLAVEEMKQKSISTIYKQLAKLFHPDLEQDETLRTEKEALMKELTVAYEAKNLHTLLLLELKWIHKESDHLDTLSEEKLKVYLQILREQATELEHEKITIVNQPRYQILLQEFGYAISSQPVLFLSREEATMKTHISEMKQDVNDFTSKDGLKHIKTLIKQWKRQSEERITEDDIFEMMMANFK